MPYGIWNFCVFVEIKKMLFVVNFDLLQYRVPTVTTFSNIGHVTIFCLFVL